MQDELKNTPQKVVGLKQVMRELEADNIARVYVAEDAEQHLKHRIQVAAGEKNVAVVTVPTMEELGDTCGIEVGAACAGIRKDN